MKAPPDNADDLSTEEIELLEMDPCPIPDDQNCMKQNDSLSRTPDTTVITEFEDNKRTTTTTPDDIDFGGTDDERQNAGGDSSQAAVNTEQTPKESATEEMEVDGQNASTPAASSAGG